MDPDQTQGIISELQKQRNDAQNHMALQAGIHAQVRAALDKAQKRITELEAKLKDAEPPAEAEVA
jgi:BMFP domain-containing protein YqiC